MGITDLPTEIQIDILSYLCFEDQVNASAVCGIWNNILKRSSFKQTRYNPKETWGKSFQAAAHKSLFFPFEISCIAINGTIESYALDVFSDNPFLDDISESGHMIPAKPSIDITNSSILDDAFVQNAAELNYDYGYIKATLEIREPEELSIYGMKEGLKTWEVEIDIKPETSIRDVLQMASKAALGLSANGLGLSTSSLPSRPAIKSIGEEDKVPSYCRTILGKPWLVDDKDRIEHGRYYKIRFQPVFFERFFRCKFSTRISRIPGINILIVRL
ncbi:hypothetical protein TWF694_004708 [Orbilia ellipsospora]|uniref:F-box domain-containing protein n=1 Tax=Orbilia ellipsospora TaxID=2528407 RepID=A0AAV9WVZ4_9PEZI